MTNSQTPYIAVIFNEPIINSEERKFISESGQLSGMSSYNDIISNVGGNLLDLSEIGVIEEREQIEKVLKERGYQTKLFNINSDIKRLINFLDEEKPNLIFNLCESLKGLAIHEMHVAALYELIGINYTGAGSLSLGTCLNKARTKELFKAHKIPTASYRVYNSESEINTDNIDIRFPLIVKPLREDASIGIENSSIVKNEESLISQVSRIIKVYKQPALVEEYIEGRELNVAIIGNEDPLILPISEIDFSTLPPDYPKIVTYNAKWVEGTAEYNGTVGICPAKLSTKVENEVKDIALNAYTLMEIRDYARVDIRLDKLNMPYVLEVNPNPDISRDSGFARSARTAGLSYEDMITKIVETALERIKY